MRGFSLVLLCLSASFNFLSYQVRNGVYSTVMWKRVAEPEETVPKSIWGSTFLSCSSVINIVVFFVLFCFVFQKRVCSHQCWNCEVLLAFLVPREWTAFALQNYWGRNLWETWFMQGTSACRGGSNHWKPLAVETLILLLLCVCVTAVTWFSRNSWQTPALNASRSLPLRVGSFSAQQQIGTEAATNALTGLWNQEESLFQNFAHP